MNKIVIAAGGTGGHIYPAIAVADELKKIDDKIDIRFIGAKGRMEERIVPQYGYKLDTIVISGFKRGITLTNIKVARNLLKAVKESKRILREFNPDIVYGTGGFVSGPVLRAANKLKIKTVIQEGNSFPGITVKMLSKKADKVILNFPESKKYLKRQDNIINMFYPVRSNLKRYDKTESLSYFGLVAGKKTLFVFGGSLGADSINKELLNSVDKLIENDIQVIWQTGMNNYEYIEAKAGSYKSVQVLKYIDNIDKAYSACDLIVCRAGVSTVMELASFGCAAIFVPFPKASGNHQQKNAVSIVDKGAAMMLLDRELKYKLVDTIIDTINDKAKLFEMRESIKQFSHNESAGDIARLLIELSINRKN